MFESECPFYLYLGMTYEQYWYGDVWMTRAFFKKYQYEKEVRNEQAWLSGLYVYDAIAALLPGINPFMKGKVRPYTKKPYDFDGIRRDEDEIKRKEKEKVFAEAYMMSMFANGQSWGLKKSGEVVKSNV